MSREEDEDLRATGRFRVAPGMMEGKWFADTDRGVRSHAASLDPDGDCLIVATDLPSVILSRRFRSANLDGFGPASYPEAGDLEFITPLFEFASHDD